MAKEKPSPLKRRVRFLQKGMELVVNKLFEYDFQNEDMCLELDERIRKIEKRLKK